MKHYSLKVVVRTSLLRAAGFRAAWRCFWCSAPTLWGTGLACAGWAGTCAVIGVAAGAAGARRGGTAGLGGCRRAAGHFDNLLFWIGIR